jgi:tetratricopeptide (TPR) repeat protein
LFTDLVESTATSDRLGPEAAEELRQTHLRLLRGAITGSGGDEVKNMGDGLMVTYSSPSRALAGAVGIQQAIENHNRRGAQPLSVRIGVSAGEAVEEDGDYFGDPVVEAARLCGAASGGQILVAEVVRRLVGRHATQTFGELDQLELRGIPTPVEAVEVLWEPAAVKGAVSLPGPLVGAASDVLFGFFGRATELATLHEACKRAHATRRCQMVLVSGEAGIGKTALLAQMARSVHEHGTTVLFGRADEDLGVAYQPWFEAISSLVRESNDEWISGLRPAQRAALARLAPHITASTDRVADADTERLLLLEGVVELLAAASRDVPVLIVLDDLQWADLASLQLLRHVIWTSTSMDVTIASTYRDADLGRAHPLTKLLSDLYRHGNVRRLPLAGLDDVDMVELMTGAAGHELDELGVGLAHAVCRETDGNPFFATEILRHLGESGGIVLGDDGRWTVVTGLDELALPTSVRDVVGRRIERLGDEALRVLSLGAVIGREFDVGVLANVADVGEGTVLDLIDAAVGAAVLTEAATVDRYRFAHALIQHSLYEELSPARRQRAHKRVAGVLEATVTEANPAELAELAHHWVAATRPTDLGKALEYVRRAGDAARAALAPQDAIRWYEQALELLVRESNSDPHQRAALLALLGTVQRQAALPESRATLLDAATLALDLNDPDALVLVALGFNRSSALYMEGDEALKPIIRAALDSLGADATSARARLLVELALAHDAGTEWHDRRELALQAVEIARAGNDDAVFVAVLGTDGMMNTLVTPDRVEQAIDDFERAGTLADNLADPALRAASRGAIVWSRYQQADIAGVDAVLADFESLTSTLGLPGRDHVLGRFLIGRQLLAGHAGDAEATNERLLELGTGLEVPNTLGTYGGFLFAIRQHQGRLDEIADLFIQAARDNPSIPALRSALASMLCELGRLEEAQAQLAVEAAAGFDYPYDSTWIAAMANLMDAAATLDDQTAAPVLVDRLRTYANHVIVPSGALVNGALARPLARAATALGDHDQAEVWFAITHDIHTRLQAPYWMARGQLDHADLCLARQAEDDLARARHLAITAAVTATEHGCAGLTTRAESLLGHL